jgi:hypothetical protein
MQAVGFSRVWHNSVSALLSSASTKVLLNGVPGDRVCHAHSLRQGDPLSLMLFLLVMEVLSAMFRWAESWSLEQQLGLCPIPHWVSLYADHMVLFLALLHQELQLACVILHIFEGAFGLGCNIAKCQLVPIRCSEEQISLAISFFQCYKVDFPIKYLGLPLSTSKLPKLVLQPLANCITDKLPAWKGRILHRSGCLTLIKTMLCAVLVYTSISISLLGWLLKAIQRILKAFLWSGSEVVQNRKYIVTWCRVQRPVNYGGLGVLDMRLLGIALQARSPWPHRADASRSWASLPPSKDVVTVAFFNASIHMSLGDGESLFLWTDPWL